MPDDRHAPAPGTMTVPPAAPLLAGKRGLVMGVANDKSIAWGIARAARAHGATLAFTYQGDAFEKRVQPLAEAARSDLVLRCDVEDPDDMAAVFQSLKTAWGGLDFLVHAIAYSDKEELKGRYLDTSLANFERSLRISCYSFTALARLAEPLMSPGASLLTLTYLGAERVAPNYNVMGVAKAALEASVRYLAADLGPRGIRVNALSAGPMRTLAGSAIADARYTYRFTEASALMRRNVTLEEVGGAAVFLLSDLGGGTTGEVVHVDGGFHAVGVPAPPRGATD